MNRTRLTLTALALSAAASLALGQNADKNSAGPTKNDYRLRVLEPVEGATISGATVRVVVNTEIPAERDAKRTGDSMPRPMVDIFIDNTLKGTLRDDINVLEVDAVMPGQHKLVVLAKNQSQEIIDRKEVKFNVVAATAGATMSEKPAMTHSSTLEERPVQSAPPPAAPRPQASAPPMPASDPMPPTRPQTAAPVATTETREARLPATGTSDLAVAAAGLALLVGGLSLRRRV